MWNLKRVLLLDQVWFTQQICCCFVFKTASPRIECKQHFVLLLLPLALLNQLNFEKKLDSICLFLVSLVTLEFPPHTQQLASPSPLIKSEEIAETKPPQQLAQRAKQSSLSFHCYPRHCGTASTVPKPLLEMAHFIPLISSYTTGVKNRGISFINFYECYVSVYLCGLRETPPSAFMR